MIGELHQLGQAVPVARTDTERATLSTALATLVTLARRLPDGHARRALSHASRPLRDALYRPETYRECDRNPEARGYGEAA